MIHPAFRALAATVALAGALSAPAFAHESTIASQAAAPAVTLNAGAARLNAAFAKPDKKTRFPICGVQFTFTLSPNQTALFFTFGWPSSNYIDWTVMNDTTNTSNPAVSLTNVATQYTGSGAVTYWLTVQNLTAANQAIEGRYCYLG